MVAEFYCVENIELKNVCVIWDISFYFGFCLTKQDTFALRVFFKNVFLRKTEKKKMCSRNDQKQGSLTVNSSDGCGAYG